MASSTTPKRAAIKRANKLVMEKRRRERINTSLEQLKSIILSTSQSDPSEASRFEKADILEKTVLHLRGLQRQQLSSAACSDPSVYVKYQAGFRECADEVVNYLTTIDGVSGEVHARILSHLQHCLGRVTTLPNIHPASSIQSKPMTAYYQMQSTAAATAASTHPMRPTAASHTTQPLRLQIPQHGASPILPTHPMHGHYTVHPVHPQHPYPSIQHTSAQSLIAGIPPTPPPSSVDSSYPTQQSPLGFSHTSQPSDYEKDFPSTKSSHGLPLEQKHTAVNLSHMTKSVASSQLSPSSVQSRLNSPNEVSRCSSANSLSAASNLSDDSFTVSVVDIRPHPSSLVKPSMLPNINQKTMSFQKSSHPFQSKDMNNILEEKDINMNVLKDEVPKRGIKRSRESYDIGKEMVVKKERRDVVEEDGDCWRPW